MYFEYYVLNYDFNAKKVINFNVFRNCTVNKLTLTEVKDYLDQKESYEYNGLFGFAAFVKKLSTIIQYQEWSRREYEISVGDAFETDCNKLEKWDCYGQCKPNMEMIAREVVWQYQNQEGQIND